MSEFIVIGQRAEDGIAIDFSKPAVGELVRCKDCKYGKWKISELDNKTKGYECAIHAVFENDFGDKERR